MNRPHRQHLLRQSMGFLTNAEDEKKLLAEDRLQPVLVRMGGGRFVCPIQDLSNLREIIKASGMDYIRDVSVQSDKN